MIKNKLNKRIKRIIDVCKDNIGNQDIYILSMISLLEENYISAIHYLNELIKIDIANYEYYFYLGYAHFQLKEYMLSLKFFLIAHKLNPLEKDHFYYISNVYIKMNEFSNAIEWEKKLLAIDPKNKNSHWRIGDLYKHIGKKSLAFKHYCLSIKFDNRNHDAFDSLGLYLFINWRLKCAEYCFRKAIKLMPTFAISYNNLGRLCKFNGKNDLAIEYFCRAFQLEPENCEYKDEYVGQASSSREPVKLERYSIESEEEWAARLGSGCQWLAGTGTLIKTKNGKGAYRIDSGEFTLNVSWQDWAMKFNLPSQGIHVKVDRYMAKLLWRDGPAYDVRVTLVVVNGSISINKVNLMSSPQLKIVIPVFTAVRLTEGHML
jgi:tetratricopeptide (TPR) repeat protein